MHNIAPDLAPLHGDFAANASSVRILLLVSPT
jgi:hypothetical protein